MADFEPKQFGKYFLIDKLAVGGMAEIYKAKTYGVDGFEKLLAIKRILPHAAADRDFITMLIDEAKLSVLLSHANIVQVYDLGKVGDDYFIAMEFINGVNMRDIMYACRELGRSIPTDIAVYMVSEVCKGLDYAHRKTDIKNQPLGIVHRDISPQNVLISYEGEVKIVDFGIAKAAMNISHTMAGILKGKIAYMSPEQAMGKSIDRRTDIFSTGILLYEALTGAKLFTGESQFEVLKKIRTSDIRPDNLPETVPGPLKLILAKALSAEPDERYQNAGDFQIDLTKYLYSTYVDFSPRKLAAFIHELFQESIVHTQETKVREAVHEAQTTSMNIEEGAKQIDIVHREVTEPRADVTAPIRGPKEELIETAVRRVAPVAEIPTPTPAPATAPAAYYPRRKGRGLLKAALLVGLVVAAAAALWRFVPQVRFWERPTPTVSAATAMINSEPPGAAIIIDGKPTGLSTPAMVPSLEVGKSYRIRLEKTGHVPVEQMLAISSPQPLMVTIPLAMESGSINIVSTPPGAQIIVNSDDTGRLTPSTIDRLPLNVDQRITLKKEGYESAEQIVRLTGTEAQTVTFTLNEVRPELGTINIVSEPPGAGIEIDGKDIGRVTPSTVENLELGTSHRLTLTLKGFEPFTTTFELKDTSPYDIRGDLKPPKAAEPEKPAVAEKGSIRVTSTPSGALVYLNRRSTGKRTPATLSDLATGKKYRVGVSLDGYTDYSTTITVGEARSYDVTASLAPKPPPTTPTIPPVKPEPPPTQPPAAAETSLRVTSNPSGADVYVNSQYRGVTPLTTQVTPGSVSVAIRKSGYKEYSRTVSARTGKQASVSGTLESLAAVAPTQLHGEVSLSSEPPRATVTFDGQTIPAKTPVTVRNVRTDRSHTVTISMSGYRSWTRTFNLSGASTSFHAVLQPD